MLEVDHIHKEFGSVCAVNDVAFTIKTGQTFGLIGPNGAGKTTTMRTILGILEPDRGEIRWNGKPVGPHSRRLFGYLPEERGLYGKMKVTEQIVYFGKLHGLSAADAAKRADRWIEQLALGAYFDRPCSELSKGNQQKVQVACSAVHEPELLVLDEPFSGLDPVNADILISVLNSLKSRGMTLVLSSHQMWQLEELCDEFCIIAGGENRANGTLSQLRADWPTRVVRVAPASDAARSALESASGFRSHTNADGTLESSFPASTDFASLLRSVSTAAPISMFQAIEPTLHEIYLHATGEKATA